jgi:hypothetical protein
MFLTAVISPNKTVLLRNNTRKHGKFSKESMRSTCRQGSSESYALHRKDQNVVYKTAMTLFKVSKRRFSSTESSWPGITFRKPTLKHFKRQRLSFEVFPPITFHPIKTIMHTGQGDVSHGVQDSRTLLLLPPAPAIVRTTEKREEKTTNWSDSYSTDAIISR